MINDAQRAILRHAIGADSETQPPCWRNFYDTDAYQDSYAECRALVDQGLMELGGEYVGGGDRYWFRVTSAGVSEVTGP